MHDLYNYIENYNPNKKRKIIIFDDMINNKKLNPIVAVIY